MPKQHAGPDGPKPEQILVAETATIPPSNPVAEASTVAPGGVTASDKPIIDRDDRDATTLDGPALTAVPADGPRHVRYFGDYELIQEIARGGMATGGHMPVELSVCPIQVPGELRQIASVMSQSHRKRTCSFN